MLKILNQTIMHDFYVNQNSSDDTARCPFAR